jgi:glyoxylase-like metal-dependent hydrolase (beta-lactamase superfamily II)
MPVRRECCTVTAEDDGQDVADARTGSVTRVSVPAQTRWPEGRTNAYLAGSLLVDPPAVDDELTAVVDGATTAIDHVAVTHAHPDHVGGVAEYAAETGATVWAHADHVPRFVDAAGVDPDRTFRDGDRIGPATVVATPGHAPDHVTFAFTEADDGRRAACCGDLAVAEGSVAVAAPEGDLAAYLDSLRRLRDEGFDVLYPGHGPVIDDPDATLTRLLDHRLDRERRVLSAVDDGARDVEAVLERAYDKDLTGVEELARRTVVAHLRKLADEGLLAYDADAGTVRPTDSEG